MNKDPNVEKQIKKVSKERQEYLKFKPFADDLRKAESWCDLDGVLNRYQTVKNLSKMGYRKIPENIGDFSDGYHTFNELYHHRAILFSVICNAMPDKAWKSKLHDTGDMFDGMFIVGIETPEGQATYHYDIDPYWDMFKVKELEKAPKWDGHTPQDVIERIAKLSAGINTCIDASKWIPITSEKKPRHLRNYFIAYVFGDSDMHFFSEAKYHAYGGNGIVEGPNFSNEGVDV